MPDSSGKLHPLAVLGRADHAQGCLEGYCRTIYGTLVALLGEPHVYQGDKITVEWAFRCKDGTVFTVYDWKELSTPLSEYHWHIGGTGRPLEAFTRHTGLRTVPLTWKLVPAPNHLNALP